MTVQHVFAPVPGPRQLSRVRCWSPFDLLEDPLERAMALAVVLVSAVVSLGAVLHGTLATSQTSAHLTPREECALAVWNDAHAFASVLGDDRPIPMSFAERWCDQQ